MYVYVFNKVIQKTEMVLREHTIWEKLIKKQKKKNIPKKKLTKKNKQNKRIQKNKQKNIL